MPKCCWAQGRQIPWEICTEVVRWLPPSSGRSHQAQMTRMVRPGRGDGGRTVGTVYVLFILGGKKHAVRKARMKAGAENCEALVKVGRRPG